VRQFFWLFLPASAWFCFLDHERMESGIGFRLYGCKDLAVDFYQGLAGKRGVADAQAVVSLSGLSVMHWLPAAVRGSGNPCTSVWHWLPAAVRGSVNPCTSVLPWLPAAIHGSVNPCTSVLPWLPAAIHGSVNPCTSVWHWLPAAVRGSGNPCTSMLHWLPAAIRGSGNPCTSVCMAHMRSGVIKKLYLRLRETSAQQLF
jgi:hypothetical protein